MFDLDGFWLYKSQVMKNPTMFLVFLRSCAAARLHCAAARLHCAAARLHCAAARVHCAAARLYCAVARLRCDVVRKMCMKNSCFSRWNIWFWDVKICDTYKFLSRKKKEKKSKTFFCRVCIFPQGPFFSRKIRKHILPCVHFPAGACFFEKNVFWQLLSRSNWKSMKIHLNRWKSFLFVEIF